MLIYYFFKNKKKTEIDQENKYSLLNETVFYVVCYVYVS